MWKDFFYFTKTERQGIIVLVVLILGVLLLPNLFPLFNRLKEVDTLKQEIFQKEYNEFIASLEEVESHKKSKNPTSRPSVRKEITPFAFDPNTADSMTFLSLGLPAWMAKNILNYRRRV